MTRRISNHVKKDKGLNFDDDSFSVGSIPGVTRFKLKDVLDSGKPHKNKSVLGVHNIQTVRVFKSDIDRVNNYLIEIKKYAFSMGYVERCGRGNKGPQLSFAYALYYKLKGLNPEEAACQFLNER